MGKKKKLKGIKKLQFDTVFDEKEDLKRYYTVNLFLAWLEKLLKIVGSECCKWAYQVRPKPRSNPKI